MQVNSYTASISKKKSHLQTEYREKAYNTNQPHLTCLKRGGKRQLPPPQQMLPKTSRETRFHFKEFQLKKEHQTWG